MKGKIKSIFVLLASTMAILLMAVSAWASGSAVVNTDALNVRADMSYSDNIIGVVYRGDNLSVLSGQDGWLKINFKDTYGFVNASYVVYSEETPAPYDWGMVSVDLLNVRSAPSFDSDKVGELAYGDMVNIKGMDGDFYRIALGDKTAYVAKQYIEVGDYGDLSSRSASIRMSRSNTGMQVVEKAKEYLGTPYVYGGSSPKGFDCSGFTSYVYAQFGQSLSRTAAGQASNGVAVSRDNLLPGDLVFFNTYGGISHVGIYVGNGQMIHSPYSGKTVCIESINSSYYSSRYVTARRIVE